MPPILFYGCHIWQHVTRIKSITKELEHVQKMVLLGITGVMKSTSTSTKALDVATSLIPVYLYYAEKEAIIIDY